MGFLDKLLGRSKKTEAEASGDASMGGEGMPQQQAGMAEERAASAEESAEEMAQRAPEPREEPGAEREQ